MLAAGSFPVCHTAAQAVAVHLARKVDHLYSISQAPKQHSMVGATIADGVAVFVHPGAAGQDDTAVGCTSGMLTLLVGNTLNPFCAADAGSAESPPHAARVGARGGHFGAFFSQVKDVASKVRT